MNDGPNTNDNAAALPERLTVESAADVLDGLLSPKRKKAEPAEDAPTEKELETPDDGTPAEEKPAVEDEGTEKAEDNPTDPEPEEEVEKPTEPQKYKVKIDGVETEVTEDELLNGYSRQSDYTRKTQELAEARKKFETEELPAVRAERQQFAEGLKQIEDALKSLSPQEPDWDKMRIEAPEQFATARAEWQLSQERIAAVSAAKAKADAAVAADQKAQLNEYVQSEHTKLLEKLPAWKDDKVADKEKQDIAKYAQSLGYSDADLASVRDHRLMLILRDAALGKSAAEKKPEIRNRIEAIRAATPGPTDANRPKQTELTKARAKLRQTGKLTDAADILSIMDKEGKL